MREEDDDDRSRAYPRPDAPPDSVPVGTPDYSSYVVKIREAKPTAIVEALESWRISDGLPHAHELSRTRQSISRI